jgi:transmembrane sensor
MPDASQQDEIDFLAYEWVQREHDGLSADCQAELQAWLDADPRHAAAFDEYKNGWSRFGPLSEAVVTGDPTPDPQRFAPAATSASKSILLQFQKHILPLAAAIFLVFSLSVFWRGRGADAPPQALSLPALCEQRTLDDGTVVELNRGAQIRVEYSDAIRRVVLLQGEANFSVAKNPDRPFIVDAAGVQVRAIGTVFNVRHSVDSVRVVVTEGRVQVEPRSAAPQVTASLLEAGQKTDIALNQPALAPAVVKLAAADLERELLWQPKLLDFDNVPLGAIVEEFNRRNPVHLVINDRAIAARPMTATFRSDNVEGLVRLLEENFGVRATRLSNTEIQLARK